MNNIQEIIQHCHERHAVRDALRQRKTVVTLALHKPLPYQIKTHCARRNPLTLEELENANISFMPIGHAPDNDHAPQDFGGHRFKRRQKRKNWSMRQWRESWGIQIYTGIPSQREGALWHDFEIKYDAICAAPDAITTCLETLLNLTANPLLTITKSGGLRFSCRIQNYLHPNTDKAKYYIYKYKPTKDKPDHRVIYMEVRGDEGYSRWDMRYEILLGNLLEPPIISKEVVFAPIHQLRATLHEPEPSQQDIIKTTDVNLPAFSSTNLELAKEAFLKRGYTYDQESNSIHYWKHGDEYVLMWEDQGIVWTRAATPNTEIPTTAVAITDIWHDTSISTKTEIREKVDAIRKGDLSPLAIKRLPPNLHKSQTTSKQYQSLKTQQTQLKHFLERDTRILAFTSSDAAIFTNTEVEKYLLKNKTTCLNISSRSFAETAEERYRTNSQTTVARWRSRLYRWEEVKDIPPNIRMANPFQHGNMCEDPERCKTLEKKGGNPNVSLCPKCPVYTSCQERGFLSQPTTLQRANAKISAIGQLFLEPRHAHLVEKILGSTEDTQNICIIDERKTSIEELFLECVLSKNVIQQWNINWQGHALGNFAAALINAIEAHGEPYSNPIGQVRAAVQAFKQHEHEIIKQMCYINVQGKVVERTTLDTETETELAHYAIDFQDRGTAVIPLDDRAENRLHEMGMPTISLNSFTPNENVSIPIDITQAITFGILDVLTLENIESFPTVCPDPNRTYWHQLKQFFAHYPRDADTPMYWNNTHLTFWLPPKLHPNVKRLVFLTPFFNEQQLRRIFPNENMPNENMDVIHLEPTSWMPSNKLFQIRTSSSSQQATLNYNSHTNNMELTKIGERYIIGIRTEIEKDLNIKHGIFAHLSIVNKLQDITTKPNVCFVKSFKTILYEDTDVEAAQVLWVVGIPQWQQRTILQHTRMLFGNDEKPLNYDEEIWTDDYNDQRIGDVHYQYIVGLLTQIIGRAGLSHSSANSNSSTSNGKTVMLLNNYELPDITDRPQTLLFDWEDFEIAGGIDKLEETIRIREGFEAERDNFTAETSRKEVERVLGCSSRQANRFLKKLRGGNIQRVSYREQILFLLSSGREKTTASLIAAIDSSPQAIGNELNRLLKEDKIVRVRRGVYTLPEFHKPTHR